MNAIRPSPRAPITALVRALAGLGCALLLLPAGGCLDWNLSVCHADRMNDRDNCGACGVVCPSGQACVQGRCGSGACSGAGMAMCGGACVDARIDRDHCGACDHACDVAAPVCSSGQCVAVTQLAAGYTATCALLADGTARCWGDNHSGQLGAGVASDLDPVPRTVTLASGEPLRNVQQLAAGGGYACAVTGGGGVFCWGDNTSGQCGAGPGAPTRIDHATPVVDTAGAPLADVARVSAGRRHACAITSGNGLYCWGDNSTSQFGAATTPRNPAAVMLARSNIRDVGAGGTYTCVVSIAPETISCFGSNPHGEIGRGDAPSMTGTLPAAPVRWPTDGLAHTPIAFLAVGDAHVCAGIGQPGAAATLYCWGNNTERESVPDSTTAALTAPQAFSAGGTRGPVLGAAPGGLHTCVWNGGIGACAGRSVEGQLGGTPTAPSVPVVAVPLVSAMTAGALHTCALAVGSSVVNCWGSNQFAQLGDRDAPPTTLSSRSAPQPVHW